ncbi:hypothetical protein [Williamsia sp. M5A3_1d]
MTRTYAFHASDRLITRTHPKNQTEAWDIASNKTVIVVGSDCWLVIGYTGLAYLDNLPTDQFIAEAIAGSSGMVGMGGWHQTADKMNYRAITERIEDAMGRAYQRLPAAAKPHTTVLLGAGLQFTSSSTGIRHVMFEAQVSTAGAIHHEIGERHQPLNRFGFHSVGSVDVGVREHCRAAIKEYGADSPENIRASLIDAVQATGAKSDVVGEDVMSVTLIPGANRIEAYFTQAPESRAVKPPAPSPDYEHSPLVYTPYLLVPGMFFSPSVATPGGWITMAGTRHEIHFDVTGPGLEAIPGGPYYFGSHARRQPR